MGRLISNQEFQNSPYGALADNLDNLTTVIDRAEATIESLAGQTFGVATYTETVRPPITSSTETTIFLKNRPVVSVTQVRIRRGMLFDWDVLDPRFYIVETGPGYIYSNNELSYLASMSSQSYSLWTNNYFAGWDVEVTYTAGAATIPGDIKQAALLQTVLYAYQDTQIYARTDDHDPGILYLQKMIDRIILKYTKTATVYQQHR